MIQTWVDVCDFGGLSTQDTRGLFWFGPLSPTSRSGVFHVRVLNQVLKREREMVQERYANDLGFDRSVWI